MADYYIQNPERLLGQPKRTIADYVEQNGILVPRRFDSIREARASGKPVLLRSEHPQEYDGVSGLLHSFGLTDTLFFGGWDPDDHGESLNGKETLDDIKAAYFRRLESKKATNKIEFYCDFVGIDEKAFREEVSFSMWEKLPGYNRAIVADSAIPNKYHIMTYSRYPYFNDYVIVENGSITLERVPLAEDLQKGLHNLIKTYENVRKLDRFDPNHCPIMEFQTVDGKDYFLQYHRTRDFSPVDFVLERDLQEGETETLFVRGATSKEGENFKVTVHYSYYEKKCKFDPEDEDGSFDFHYNHIFSELQGRKRKLQVVSEKSLRVLDELTEGHELRSKIFKPRISAVFPFETLEKDKNEDFFKEARKGRNTHMNLHLVSDGRRAFVKRI